jgi:hypothetical protein
LRWIDGIPDATDMFFPLLKLFGTRVF